MLLPSGTSVRKWIYFINTWMSHKKKCNCWIHFFSRYQKMKFNEALQNTSLILIYVQYLYPRQFNCGWGTQINSTLGWIQLLIPSDIYLSYHKVAQTLQLNAVFYWETSLCFDKKYLEWRSNVPQKGNNDDT